MPFLQPCLITFTEKVGLLCPPKIVRSSCTKHPTVVTKWKTRWAYHLRQEPVGPRHENIGRCGTWTVCEICILCYIAMKPIQETNRDSIHASSLRFGVPQNATNSLKTTIRRIGCTPRVYHAPSNIGVVSSQFIGGLCKANDYRINCTRDDAQDHNRTD